MSARHRTARKYFALALGLGLIFANCAGPSAFGGDGPQVPFKGTVTAQYRFVPTQDPYLFVVDYVGTGQATLLGRFTVTAQYLVNIDYVLDFLEEEEEVQGVDFVFTAANGDQLFGNYDGTTNPVGPDLVAFEADATFTGGTGRFEGATGSYVTIGVVMVNLLTLTGEAFSVIEGTVSAPGR